MRSSIGLWTSMAIGFVLLVGAVFASRFGQDPDLVASPILGQSVSSQRVPFLEGAGDFGLDDLEGDILVVNFWASWCTGCRVEHDALLTASNVFADSGVSFVGVLHQDQPRNGIAFLDEVGRGDLYRYVFDSGSRLAVDFGLLGLPQTFFVDREGEVVGQINGPAKFDNLAGAINAILVDGALDSVTKTGELQNR